MVHKLHNLFSILYYDCVILSRVPHSPAWLKSECVCLRKTILFQPGSKTQEHGNWDGVDKVFQKHFAPISHSSLMLS